ncbi:outer membrane protein assembly factor BamD [Polaribacter sp. WD7]|uniref:tetratricopeptide repeat protein n=1 Tax=Polaribacter sp. WD7 TaxID=2269061 RepID=UPI000DF23D6C|nr:tetratricopeptide repeat protein [Polaribacter sp. WD7]RCS26106.1 outer membrane protein assembly factor BamD [Polaribacter sp. WD7]
MKQILILFFLAISSFSYAQNEYLLAENYFREGAYLKASQIYKKLYEKSPFNTTYLNRLISCYQETENFTEVENLLTSKIKQSPNQGYLYVYLGYNYERQKQPELAQKNYTIALNSIDKNSAFGGIIGRIFKEYNLLDNAILAYKKTMAKDENTNYSFQIAQIYGEKGDLKEMFQSYIDLVNKNENYYNLVQRYASKYITDDSENEANILFRKTLLKKAASNPKDVWNVLLSWLFSQQKDYEKAFIQQKALYRRNPVSLSGIFELGEIAYNNNAFTASKTAFNFIIQNTTIVEEKIDAHWYLAKIAVAIQDSNTNLLFQSLFSEFGKNPLTIKLQVAYADFLTFYQNKPQQAKLVLEEALTFSRSKYDKARIKLKLGDILVFTEQYNKALIYFSQIQTQLKGDELAQQARFKVAQTSYFKGDFTWAKAQLKILKSSTTQLIANDALALFLTITDNEPVDSIPSGLIQYAKAELYAFQNKTQQALDTLNTIKRNFKGQPIEDEVLFKQAKLYIKQQEFEKAVANFKQVISLNPQGILIDDAHYQLAELYKNHLNNLEKASEYYQKIIFDYPSSIYLVDARKKYRKIRGDNL